MRHDIGVPNGDIGRMKRQQSFIAAMIEKVVSKGTLTNLPRLYRFLNAATKSLTTDTGFAHLRELASLGSSLKNIGLDNVQFITVPNEAYAPDPNRLQISPERRTCGARSGSTSRSGVRGRCGDRPAARAGRDAQQRGLAVRGTVPAPTPDPRRRRTRPRPNASRRRRRPVCAPEPRRPGASDLLLSVRYRRMAA